MNDHYAQLHDRVALTAMRNPLACDETLVTLIGTVTRVWTSAPNVTIVTDDICACCDKPRAFVRRIADVHNVMP